MVAIATKCQPPAPDPLPTNTNDELVFNMDGGVRPSRTSAVSSGSKEDISLVSW